MEIFILILSLILQAAVLRHLSDLSDTSQHCTAEPARRWAFAACLCSLAATALQLAPDHASLQWRTAALHLAVVGQLTPFICILGARRPGVSAWPYFVIVPMIAVFQWPSISQLMAESADTPLIIERPSSIGLILVVVMGVGNYFGTRFTAAALLSGLGIVLQHLAVSEWTVDEWVAPANGWLIGIG